MHENLQILFPQKNPRNIFMGHVTQPPQTKFGFQHLFQDLLAREISWFDLLWSIVKALNLRLLHNKSICLVKQQWNFSGFLAGCNKFPIIIQTQKNSRLVRLTQELHVPFHKDHCCTSNSRKSHEENRCYFRGVYIISMTAHNSRELLKIIENTHSFVLTSEMFFFYLHAAL